MTLMEVGSIVLLISIIAGIAWLVVSVMRMNDGND